jgi:hypothetical protein
LLARQRREKGNSKHSQNPDDQTQKAKSNNPVYPKVMKSKKKKMLSEEEEADKDLKEIIPRSKNAGRYCATECDMI